MESPYHGKTGLKRIWNALFYSLDGLAAASKHEDAFRQEVLLPLVMMYGGPESRRCLLATNLYFSLFWNLDPNSVMFVNFDPMTGRGALDRLRWSDPALELSDCPPTTTRQSYLLTSLCGRRGS